MTLLVSLGAAQKSWGSSGELGQLRRGVDTPGVAPQGEAPPGEALPWFGLGFKVGIRA